MEKFKSDPQVVNYNINVVYDKLSTPSRYKNMLEANADKMPNEVKENFDKIKFNEDSISIESPMGEVTLGVDKAQSCQPTRVVYSALSSPVKFSMSIELKAIDENATEEFAQLEVDLPFFVAKMVGPQLKAAAGKFGELLKMLPYDNI